MNVKEDRYKLKPEVSELFKGSLIRPLGINPVRKVDISGYLKWLDLKYNGQLKYLENNLECRKDPSYILEGVRSIIPVILPYYSIIDKSIRLKEKYGIKVSYYSFIKDYHLIIKSQLKPIVDRINERFKGEKCRVVVDSAPIFEKYNAALTGMGEIGKNTLFIHRAYGSFIFLGEILTTIDIDKLGEKDNDYGCDTRITGNTDGSSKICKKECNMCVKSCPSSSITSNGVNVSECLSYLSIEYRGSIERKYWKWFKDSFFGCDKCQMVCIYNKKIIKDHGMDIDIGSDIDIDQYILSEEQIFYLKDPKKILFMNEAEFKKIFKETSFLRAGYEGIARNIMIHLAVNKDKDLMEIVSSKRLNPLVWKNVSYSKIMEEYGKN